jgi:hypothetical protein
VRAVCVASTLLGDLILVEQTRGTSNLSPVQCNATHKVTRGSLPFFSSPRPCFFFCKLYKVKYYLTMTSGVGATGKPA